MKEITSYIIEIMASVIIIISSSIVVLQPASNGEIRFGKPIRILTKLGFSLHIHVCDVEMVSNVLVGGYSNVCCPHSGFWVCFFAGRLTFWVELLESANLFNISIFVDIKDRTGLQSEIAIYILTIFPRLISNFTFSPQYVIFINETPFLFAFFLSSFPDS